MIARAISLPWRLTPLLLVLAAVVGIWSGFQVILRQDSELEALRTTSQRLTAQNSRETDSLAEVTVKLGAAANELDRLSEEEKVAGEGEEAQVRSWLRRTSRLRQYFVNRPEQSIPELQLLTEKDWLRLSWEFTDLDSETFISQALSKVRSEAERKFALKLSLVFIELHQMHGKESPVTQQELTEALEPDLAAALSQRYIPRFSTIGGRSALVGFERMQRINPELDRVFSVGFPNIFDPH